MATFYQGYRDVLKGRNSKNNIHHWKGTVGVYSNWSLMNTDHVFDGMPDNETVLGVERPYSNTRLMEKLFAGHQHIAPMKDPGEGTLTGFGRFRPLEYKGLVGAKVFPDGFGHAVGVNGPYSLYSNFIYDGLPGLEPLANPGHPIRYSTTYGGAFNPWVHKGVPSSVALEGPGDPLPAGYDNPYGKNKVLEWRGVPSAKAL